jgi:hypothetical protein
LQDLAPCCGTWPSIVSLSFAMYLYDRSWTGKIRLIIMASVMGGLLIVENVSFIQLRSFTITYNHTYSWSHMLPTVHTTHSTTSTFWMVPNDDALGASLYLHTNTNEQTPMTWCPWPHIPHRKTVDIPTHTIHTLIHVIFRGRPFIRRVVANGFGYKHLFYISHWTIAQLILNLLEHLI